MAGLEGIFWICEIMRFPQGKRGWISKPLSCSTRGRVTLKLITAVDLKSM